MRIQLDISESEIGEAAKLLLWREQLLKVVISPVDDPEILDERLESIDL